MNFKQNLLELKLIVNHFLIERSAMDMISSDLMKDLHYPRRDSLGNNSFNDKETDLYYI